jgi:hypothetical protein
MNNHASTTFGLFYRGFSDNGGTFTTGNSFTYATDMNGDGVNNDLIYIPKGRGDIRFNSEADEDAFWAFVEQDKYLKKNKGKYAEAYAARAPFTHTFDLRVLQNFYFNTGARKHTLQFSFDIMNVGNLLNSKWGVPKNMNVSNNGAILRLNRIEDNVPVFEMAKNTAGDFLTKTYDRMLNVTNLWYMQVGVRYIF